MEVLPGEERRGILSQRQERGALLLPLTDQDLRTLITHHALRGSKHSLGRRRVGVVRGWEWGSLHRGEGGGSEGTLTVHGTSPSKVTIDMQQLSVSQVSCLVLTPRH